MNKNIYKKIKEFVNKNKFVLVIILLLLGLFYWYEYRPAQIKKDCYKTAEWWANGSGWAFDYHYRQCLRSKGF